MTLEQISELPRTVSVDCLDRLEAIWLSGEIPDISHFLRQLTASRAEIRCSLVELDLEYRWKRYCRGSSMSERDPFGFPLYPRLEDYANLLTESERSQLLTPRLLAEEYRVRRFWGDQPSREQFLTRLPQQSLAIETALNQIDTEFEVEGMTPLEDESAEFQDAESTLINHIQQATSEITILTPTIGKYHLHDLLGRGGFGEVWRAYDPNLKRYVALKFPRPDRKFSPDLMDYFRREAQKMAALEQVPGVVTVYESGESNGVPFIASSLVEGSNLGARLKEGSLTRRESVRIVAEVATTLHRAHLNDLFHRDVKLSNILVNREGKAYLSDFGLCVTEEEQLLESYSATGTYAYMSPEQIQGQSHRVDGRADIYSLGVVLYRLLTNRLPYVARTPADYIDQVVHREPRPLRSIDDEIPAELERICLKCLKKPVSERYTTAGDLAEELRSWLSDERAVTQVHSSNSRAGVRDPNRTREWSYFAWPVLVSLVLLIGFAVWHSVTSGLSPVEPVRPNTVDDRMLRLSDPDSGFSQIGFWDVTGEGKAVRVSADNFSMRELGDITEEGTLHLKLNLQELKPNSRIGVFWGLSDRSFNSNDASWEMLVIQRDSNNQYDVSIEAREIEGFRSGYTGLAKGRLDGSGRRVTLALSLTSHGLKSLAIGGEDRYDLVSKYIKARRSEHAGAGGWGLVCHYGEGVFTDPVVDNNVMTFQIQSETRE